jgi:mycothiol synthase
MRHRTRNIDAMAVRRLDTASLPDALMDGVYEVVARGHAEENPEEPCRSRAEVKAFLRHPPSLETREYWFAESGGGCVGFAQLGVMQGAAAGRVELLVHPAYRGHGHGKALLEALRHRARSLGARRLAGRHATEAGARFASAAGAKDTFREVRSVLRLPVSEELAVQPVDGYGLRSWLGPAPAELLDSFARARNAINDAPLAFDEDPEVWTPDRVRDLEAAVERRDRDVRVTVALDAAGEVVAFTELRVSRTAGAIAATEDTAVVPEHRRRGLGRWVKVESIRRLQDDRPDVRLLTTANAEQNDAMRSLNRALGFSPVTVYTNCTLELSG